MTEPEPRELIIRISEDGLLKVSVDGKTVGLITELSVHSDASGETSVRLSFPPQAVVDGLEAGKDQFKEVLLALESFPRVEVDRGSSHSYALSPLLAYFEGSGRDDAGMTLGQVLEKDLSWYERSRDFVQWLLPTRRRSYYEPCSPVLTDEDVRTFRVRKDLQRRYLSGVSRMEDFLGLLPDRVGKPSWAREKDRNHRRISRLLESLRDFGYKDRAESAFVSAMRVVRDFPGTVGAESVSYWMRAAGVGA